jgi:hypothetical protein
MKSQKTLSKLTPKIQSLKQIIKDLQKLESNQEAETVSRLLKIIVDLFEQVKQVEKRLTELEK